MLLLSLLLSLLLPIVSILAAPSTVTRLSRDSQPTVNRLFKRQSSDSVVIRERVLAQRNGVRMREFVDERPHRIHQCNGSHQQMPDPGERLADQVKFRSNNTAKCQSDEFKIGTAWCGDKSNSQPALLKSGVKDSRGLHLRP